MREEVAGGRIGLPSFGEGSTSALGLAPLFYGARDGLSTPTPHSPRVRRGGAGNAGSDNRFMPMSCAPGHRARTRVLERTSSPLTIHALAIGLGITTGARDALKPRRPNETARIRLNDSRCW